MKIARANIKVLTIKLKFEKNLFIFTRQMMNLLIDIGNSFVKVALHESRNVVKEFKFDDLKIDEIVNIIEKYKVVNSALSNVSNPNHELEIILKDQTSFFSFKNDIKIPINSPYSLKEVGDDRLALILAAHDEFPNDNVLVIDMGTCITYDLKSSSNEYKAGGISPGLKMRIKSISDGAFKLKEINPEYPKSYIASDTKSSLEIGIILGIQHEIEGFISEYRSTFSDLKVVITGGDSKILSGKIKNTIFTNSNYIFKGLDFLIEYNKQNA